MTGKNLTSRLLLVALLAASLFAGIWHITEAAAPPLPQPADELTAPTLELLKWSQPPVLNPNPPPQCYYGWDEQSLYGLNQIVADDWLCQGDNPVTKIRWWGSYFNWQENYPPPVAPATFHLAVWTDVPAGVTDPWSHPGSLIWQWVVSRHDTNEQHVGCDFYPGFPLDNCFMYELQLPPPLWFYQGPQDTIFWLSISAIYTRTVDLYPWGWKTRPHYYNDAAVRIFDPTAPVVGSVFIMGKPITNTDGPWDMAFELFTELPPPEQDFGDAPDRLYPTLLASSGARHVIVPGIFLGNSVDPEPDGQPDPAALGDDNDGNDDEDGVRFLSPIIPGQNVTIQVTASVPGFLDAWLDFHADGSWAGDQIFAVFPLVPGPNLLTFPAPIAATPNITTFARFRFSSQGGLTFTGPAIDGEVEDHRIFIEQSPEVKWLQPPDITLPGLHAHDWMQPPLLRLTLADDWYCEGGIVTDLHWWGNYELDPQGLEIRGAGIDRFHLSIHDTDPISPCLPGPELYGLDVPFAAIAETNTGLVNNEGSPIYLYEVDLAQPFIQIPGSSYWFDLAAYSVNPANPPHWRWQESYRGGTPQLCGAAARTDPVPGNWQTILWAGVNYSDMAFAVTSTPADFGDALEPSYPTRLASGGAVHFLNGPFMGSGVDWELDGQPSLLADGDDLDLQGDDEDGISFLSPMIPGQTATVTVDLLSSPAGCLLNAWADLDGNGSWTSGGAEQIFTDLPLVAGSLHTLAFSVPAPPTSTVGFTVARFRCSTQAGLGPGGIAPDGEVEDYLVQIIAPPLSPVVKASQVNSQTLRLTWPHAVTDVYGNAIAVDVYHVFSDTTPYFAPALPAWTLSGPFANMVSLTIPGALGVVSTNNFYHVHAILYDMGGYALIARSNHVGEFDFALVPGSP